jgi:predicted esterase YcpF (UPF0227 family)
MLKSDMKLLYMPGLASITDKTYDLSQSCKLVHLMELHDCTVFDYKLFQPESIVQYISNFDVLFGSSFGGYFAFYLSIRTGKPSISVNPSLYLDERIDSLVAEHEALSFIDKKALKSLKTSPTSTPASQVSVLMNMDDEVLDANKIIKTAQDFHAATYTYEKGGHESTNFQGDMLPTIKMILSQI